MPKKKPLDQYVLDVMQPKTGYKTAELEEKVRHNLFLEFKRENPRWTHEMYMEFLAQFSTVATAIKHLLYAGKIVGRMHRRGSFKWYVYWKVDTDA